MKQVQQLLALLLVFVLVFSLAGCNNAATDVIVESASATQGSTASEVQDSSENVDSAEIKTLKIGSLAALTGFFSAWDIQNDRELRVMAEILNENGGITVGGINYEFEIVTADTQSDLAGVASAAEILAYEENVNFAIETIGFFAVAASEVFEAQGILHVNNWNTLAPEEISEATPYKFVGHNSTAGSTVALVGAIKEQFPDIETAVFCTAEDGTEQYQLAAAQYACELYGIELIDSVVYNNDIVDMCPVATRLKEMDADLIIHSHMVSNAASVAKNLRASGYDTPIIYIGSTTGSEVVELCGTEAASNFMTVGVPSDGNPEIIQTLYDRVIDKYGNVSFTGCFANCLYVLAEAMKYADSVEPDDVRAALEAMDTIETIYGTGTFGGEETYGISHHAILHPSPITFVKSADDIQGWWYDGVSLP